MRKETGRNRCRSRREYGEKNEKDRYIGRRRRGGAIKTTPPTQRRVAQESIWSMYTKYLATTKAHNVSTTHANNK